MIDINLIKKNLKNFKIGKEIYFFNEIDSTNTFLKNGKYPYGTIAITESQTKGKGRRGNKWEDKSGESLLFSVLLNYSDLPINTFTLVLGLAVINAVNKSCKNANIEIKWPNDIILNNKKLGGILCEREGNKLIVGMGFNILNTKMNDLDANWTSFKKENIEIDLNAFFTDLLINIENYYDDFCKFGFQYFINDYKLNCININKTIIYEEGHKLVSAYVEDINLDGSLLVLKDGMHENIYSGTVSIRGKNGYI